MIRLCNYVEQRLKRCIVSCILLAVAAMAQGAGSVEDVTKEHWIRIDSANFRFVTDQPEAAGRAMVKDLEHLRYISNKVRGAESLAAAPLTIVAMSKSGFRQLGLPEGWGGVFTLSRQGYAALASIDGYTQRADNDDFDRQVVLHEYHHFLMHLAPETTFYPRWYDEGMAEYWSSLKIMDGTAWFGDSANAGGRDRALQYSAGFDTVSLFGRPKLRFDGSRVSGIETIQFYARSLYAVHYFNSTPELRQRLANYIRLLNMGISQEQAMRIALKRTNAELDKEMRIYAQRGAVKRGFPIGKEGLDLPEVAVTVAKLDRRQTYAVLADVVTRFTEHDSAVARELIATNLSLNPDDPDAHAIAIARGKPDDGLTRLSALLKRHPDNARLLALQGDSLATAAYGRRGTGGTGWETQAETARTTLRRAIQNDPANALAYFALGNLYAILPEGEPAQEGIACLDTAVIYEPSPHQFRLLARLYRRSGQPKEALKSMRSAVAFGTTKDQPLDALVMENLELVNDLAGEASPNDKGLRYRSGAVYEGPLLDGKPHGKGRWTRPNGSYYEGEFVRGAASGHGKLASERGAVYEGEFAAGMARGQGRIAFPAEAKLVSYEGGVFDVIPSGAGVLVSKRGRLQASFLQGEPHGAGSFTPARGAALNGTWRYGNVDWPADGKTLFTGDIDADGRRHGVGWCRIADSADKAGKDGEPVLCRYRHGAKVALEMRREERDEDED
jgi:hypothetical protein